MIQFNVSSIPFYVLEEKEDVSSITDPVSYIITKKGFLKYIKNSFYSALHKVESIDILGETDETTRVQDMKIPISLVHQVGSFFEKVYDKYKSEANVLLYHNLTTKQWRVLVPKQTVSLASVKYDHVPTGMGAEGDTPLESDGFVKVGTIHSHANFGAFQSGTDHKDESTSDGIHITIGNVNSKNKSYHSRLCLGGKHFVMDLINAINADPYDVNVPDDWINNVSEQKTSYTPQQTMNFENTEVWGGRSFGRNVPVRRLYMADLANIPEEEKKTLVGSGLIP